MIVVLTLCQADFDIELNKSSILFNIIFLTGLEKSSR